MNAETGIGASVKRKEDKRFLTGKGNYTDDININGQTHAYFVRSPHAHATLNGIDKSAALAAPGVLNVFTGEDMAAAGIGPLICGVTVTQANGEPHNAPPHSALAVGKVRHVGDHIAVVIAETLAQAKDAAELVEIDYGVLPSVTDTNSADADDAPQLHEEAGNNVCFDWAFGEKADVDAAMASAHKIAELDLINNRMVTNPMEPRAALGDYNSGTEETT